MTDYERALMSLDEAGLNQLFEKAMAAKPAAFSGARQPERSTMSIATPQDMQFAKQAKEKVAPIAQAVYEGTLADPVERLASWSALADPNTPEAVRKAAQDYVAPLPVTPEGRINEEGLSRAAGPMMGVTTYHGSPASGIRKWDLNFRGTGEGRLPVDSPARESFKDMIGHGLYSAEREGIAKGYQERLTERSYHDLGERLRKEYPELRHKVVDIIGENDPTILGRFMREISNDTPLKPQFKGIEKELREAATKIAPKGSIYTTELTPHPDEFLLWDKPLSEQSDTVRTALEGVKDKFNRSGGALSETDQLLSDLLDLNWSEESGVAVYKDMSKQLGSDRAASEYLHSLGIRGIKYLDNPSRGAGEGTYNYVMFNPAEEAIITHENGQRIPGAVEEAYRKLRDPKSKALFEERYPELKGE